MLFDLEETFNRKCIHSERSVDLAGRYKFIFRFFWIKKSQSEYLSTDYLTDRNSAKNLVWVTLEDLHFWLDCVSILELPKQFFFNFRNRVSSHLGARNFNLDGLRVFNIWIWMCATRKCQIRDVNQASVCQTFHLLLQ